FGSFQIRHNFYSVVASTGGRKNVPSRTAAAARPPRSEIPSPHQPANQLSIPIRLSNDHRPGPIVATLIPTVASTRLYSQPLLVTKKDRWTVYAATNISDTNAAPANEVSRPTANRMPAANSVVAASTACILPGRIPMLSNQPAVPAIRPPPK